MASFFVVVFFSQYENDYILTRSAVEVSHSTFFPHCIGDLHNKQLLHWGSPNVCLLSRCLLTILARYNPLFFFKSFSTLNKLAVKLLCYICTFSQLSRKCSLTDLKSPIYITKFFLIIL